MTSSSYPEHEKLENISLEERDAVARFLEWLDSQGIRLGTYTSNAWSNFIFVEIGEGHDPLMHRFWGIDKTKLAEEKAALLELVRKENR